MTTLPPPYTQNPACPPDPHPLHTHMHMDTKPACPPPHVLPGSGSGPSCYDDSGVAYPQGTTVVEYGYSAPAAPAGVQCSSLMTAVRSRVCLYQSPTSAVWDVWRGPSGGM